jgi:hypothetical protein
MLQLIERAVEALDYRTVLQERETATRRLSPLESSEQ